MRATLTSLLTPEVEGGVGPTVGIVIVVVTTGVVVWRKWGTKWGLNSIGGRDLLAIFAIYCGSWLVFGIALGGILWTLGSSGPNLVALAGIFAASWFVGFLVIVVPGGLGVREGTMAYLLSVSVTSGLGSAVAVIARVLWWLSTAVVFMAALVFKKLHGQEK